MPERVSDRRTTRRASTSGALRRLALALAIPTAAALAACSTTQAADPTPEPQSSQSENVIEKTLEIQTPTPGWQLAPIELYRLDENEYWAIHQLTAPDGMAAQVISSTSATITFKHTGAGEPEVKHFVLGKTWNWNANPDVSFIDTRDSLKDALADAEPIALISD